MTTRVTVDAHAGWPVLVEYMVGEPHGNEPLKFFNKIVKPNTTHDFYIHSGMIITRITELNNT